MRRDDRRCGPWVTRLDGRVDRAGRERAACEDQTRSSEGVEMSRVRVLVGTRKGAFVLESDGKRERWDVSGPHFGGWEIYHLKGSPADPNRLYVSQGTSWFGQLIQRSNDGGDRKSTRLNSSHS